MTTEKPVVGMDPVLSLLLDLDLIDGSQLAMREPLFQQALERIRNGDALLRIIIMEKLDARRSRLLELQKRVAFAQRDNTNLLAEVLGGKAS